MLQEHLLKQGNVEQSPVTFLNQENSDSKLLVIIKNADIAGKIHTVSKQPGRSPFFRSCP